jgi:GTP-binding protein
MRSSTQDELVRLTPATRLTLEQALEQADESECVEVTPSAVRLRKVVLSQQQRAKGKRVERRVSVS